MGKGAIAQLWSTTYPATTTSGGDRCFTFWYHMFGPNIGTLNIYVAEDNQDIITLGSPVWSLTGDQGDLWLKGAANLTSSTTYIIIIETVRGGGFEGKFLVIWYKHTNTKLTAILLAEGDGA